MKNEENILHETLQQVRELYTPANDIISKIQLKLAVGMLKSMIAAQGKVEKMGTALASRMQKYIKSKGRWYVFTVLASVRSSVCILPDAGGVKKAGAGKI